MDETQDLQQDRFSLEDSDVEEPRAIPPTHGKAQTMHAIRKVILDRLPHLPKQGNEDDDYQIQNLSVLEVALVRHASNEVASQNVDPDVQKYLEKRTPRDPPDPSTWAEEGAFGPRDGRDLGSLSDMSDLTDLTDTDADTDAGVSQEAAAKGKGKSYSRTSLVKRPWSGAAVAPKGKRPKPSGQPCLPSCPTLPSHPSLPPRPQQAFLPRRKRQPKPSRLEKPKRQERIRGHSAQTWLLDRKTEAYQSNHGYNLTKVKTSQTGWQGLAIHRSKEGASIRSGYLRGFLPEIVQAFTRIPYLGLKTRILDGSGIMFILRTFIGRRVMDLMPRIIQLFNEFADHMEKNGTGFTNAQLRKDLRGAHAKSVDGYDRNNKKTPARTAFTARNRAALDKLFRKGDAVDQLETLLNDIVTSELPQFAARCKKCQKDLGIEADHGFFFNFCLNAARIHENILRVHCDPHVDFKNLAIAFCAVFVWGKFNSKQRSWLVIWEAGVVIELPPGVFLLYPSALFFHFNVDIHSLTDRIVVTENEERPTPENTAPISAERGRGSCVWFNQASMFQTSELGYSTVREAKEAGAPTDCNAKEFIQRGVFPVKTH